MFRVLRLTRDQLSKFLPDHDSIRQFEELMNTVNDSVDTDEVLLALILGQRAPNQSGTNNRIDSLEQLAPQRKPNLTSLEQRVSNLEAWVGVS